LKSPNKLTVRLEPGATTALLYPAGSQAIGRALILGHGAGAGQQSGFMVAFARALSALGANVVTFNFLYTELGRRIPDRAPALEACFRAVIDVVRRDVYPLHPPGRPAERRDKHLALIGRPMLFVQGSRDAFGTPAELEPVLATFTPPPAMQIVDGGDHSFKLAGRDPTAQAAAYAIAQEAIVTWMKATSKAITTDDRSSFR